MHPFVTHVQAAARGTVHMPEHLDLSELHRDPKRIVTLSDITAPHNALRTLRITSLHVLGAYRQGPADACRAVGAAVHTSNR
jgi:hypothetical protein